jgi:uncharacterized membrane protein
VRSGDQLSTGERAADSLKKWFGTWTALGAVFASIAAWVALQKTGIRWDIYPFILLNLCLSCLAAVQGIILQISANRGDRISAEVALHTQRNTDTLAGQSGEILALTQQQMSMLAGIAHANAELNLIRQAVAPGVPNPAAGTDPAPSAAAAKRLASPAERGKGAAPKTATRAKPQPKGTGS